MTRLTTLLLGLLRRFLSNTFVTGSIKRLLLLINAIQRLFSRERPRRREDTSQTWIPPSSHSSHVNGFSTGEFICPSLQPPSRAADSSSSHALYDHYEQHIPHPIHSPIPQKGYLLPYAYGSPQGSQSSQDIVEGRNPDAISLSSHQSARLPSSSATSLTLSRHGLVVNSTRPNSRNSQRPSILRNGSRISFHPDPVSQPIKVSRAPTPVSINRAPPAGAIPSRQSSPLPLRTVLPMSTASVKRWSRNIIVPTTHTYCLVDPLKFKFDDDDLPPGWIRYTHPDGARYFFHEAKRIYTDANLCDPEELLVITESADQILGDLENKAQDENIELAPDVELVLEIVPWKEDLLCGYYFVEHSSRCLFWLEEFDAGEMCEEIKVVVSLSHLRYEIESQYWTHWELFPNTRDVSPSIVMELRDITLHAAADTATSSTSTAFWTTEKNQTILAMLDKINMGPSKRDGYSAWIIGRVMRNLTHNQFVHLYGQRGARLDRDQSVHGSIVNPRTLLVTLLSPVLFWAPDVHLKALEKIWVDRLVHYGPWTEFIEKLNTEWQEFIIIGTVLLNADLAFLSIQSVDNGGTMVVDRSPAQIFCYISIVTSVGSIMLALLLVRQNRGKSRQTATEAADFLGSMTHKTRGLEVLAILYALPYALLMWSYVLLSNLALFIVVLNHVLCDSTSAFLLAFLFECFFFSSAATRASVGAFSVVVSVLIAWCIITAWANEFNVSNLQLPWRADLWGRFKNMLLCRMTPGESPSQGRKESSDTPTCCSDSPAEDDKQAGKRQGSWPFMIFVRKSTADPPVQVDMGEKAEV